MRYPGAVYRPLGAQTEPRMRTHDIVCVHTMVGYLKSTDAMFRKGGYKGTESHYGVGGRWGSDVDAGLDGVAYCWQDDTFAADANLEGWHRVISIETADNAPGKPRDIAAWTPRQCETIARIIAFHCDRENIPPALIPDTKPGRRGIAWHAQGCEHSDGVGSHPGFLVRGGERWSSAKGKECPTDRRIVQLKEIVVPRVRRLLSPVTVTPPEAPMATTLDSNVQLMPYVDTLFKDDDNVMTPVQLLQHAAGQAKSAKLTADGVAEDVATLREEVVQLRELVTDMASTQVAMADSLRAILTRLPAPTP